jgi:hypothetical protein
MRLGRACMRGQTALRRSGRHCMLVEQSKAAGDFLRTVAALWVAERRKGQSEV